MKLSLYESCRKKRLDAIAAVSMLGVALLYAAVCMPVYIWAKSDILVVESVFPIIWDMVSTAVNYAFYWVSFSFMIYLAARFSLRNCKTFFASFFGAAFLLYLGSLLASCIINGFAEFVLNDLLDVLMYVAFDMGLMAIASLIAWHLLSHKQQGAARAYAIAQRKDQNAVYTMPQWLPFASFFDFANELMRALFWIIMIPSAGHILTRLYYDIFFYGLPTDGGDAAWMIFYYASEIVFFFAGYLLAILLLNFLDAREEKKKERYLAQTV